MRARLCDEHHELDRARQLIGTALDLVDESTDPRGAAMVYTWYARCSFEFHGRLSHVEALDRAIRLFGDDPSEGLVLALMTQGVVAMRRERIVEGDRALADAAEVAAAIDAPLLEAKAWHQRAWCAVWLGRLPDGVACYDEAVRADRRAGAEERVGLDLLGRGVVLMQGLIPSAVWLSPRNSGSEHVRRGPGHCGMGWLGTGPRTRERRPSRRCRRTACDRSRGDCGGRGRPGGALPPVRLLMMRGQDVAALPLELAADEGDRWHRVDPQLGLVLLHVQVLLANGLPDEALQRVRRWLPLFAESDCAPVRGTMAHAAYLAVESARRAGLPEHATR